MVGEEMGVAGMVLGGGGGRKEEEMDLGVGMMVGKKVGEKVEKGEALVTLFGN